MAEVLPIHSVRYELGKVGALADVVAPPYDVIDAGRRAELLARSPYNVVEIDLPEDPGGGDRYEHAARTMKAWLADGVLVAEEEPALWALTQTYELPGGERTTRSGFLCRVRLAPYGDGIRPHERTQPGPKEDRLRLTRATRHNLSPIFTLTSGNAWPPIQAALGSEPWAEVTDEDAVVHRIWRIPDPEVHRSVAAELAEAELLIADGHHRYETALAYQGELGGSGEHDYVLMCLVSLEDPGLTVLPTHRLLTALADDRPAQERQAAGLRELFEASEVPIDELDPASEEGIGVFGYVDSRHRQGYRLRLRDRAPLVEELGDRSDAYRELDAAILEALVLKRTFGISEEEIAAKRGIAYTPSAAAAIEALDGEADAAFLLRPTPVGQVQAVAAAGETMPPKSTYFFPKLLTGIVFNPLAPAGR